MKHLKVGDLNDKNSLWKPYRNELPFRNKIITKRNGTLKNIINCVCQEINDDMRRLGLKSNMFDNLRKKLYFSKMLLLLEKGLEDGNIVPFDEAFYERMSCTYINCIPVSMHIKYLSSIIPPGKCCDRSLFMFLCFDEALLVRGNDKSLELRYGKERDGHGWIELGDYVYDPSLLLRFKKDVYYRIYCPTNVHKYNKDDYVSQNKDFYEEIKSTTLQDFKPNGRKRTDLCVMIPLLEALANNSNDPDFKRDVCYYLASIQYEEQQVLEEMNIAFQKCLKEEDKKSRKI